MNGIVWNGRPTGPGGDSGNCVNEIILWTSRKCFELDIEGSFTINGEIINLQTVQCYNCVRLSIPGNYMEDIHLPPYNTRSIIPIQCSLSKQKYSTLYNGSRRIIHTPLMCICVDVLSYEWLNYRRYSCVDM